MLYLLARSTSSLACHCGVTLFRTFFQRCAFAVLFAASQACGAATPAQPTLTFAFDELPPWKIQVGDTASGAYTEIVRELARRVGMTVKIHPCPLKRCLYMLERGEADITIGVKQNAQRDQYLHFLHTPYRTSSSDKVFYVRREGGPAIDTFADLARLRIGAKLGADYFAAFDQDPSLHREFAKDLEVNLRKLALGRIDTVIASEDQGAAMLTRLKLDGVITLAAFRWHDPSPRSIAIARNSPHAAQLELFEKTMAAMSRDGTLAAIFNRYYYQAYRIPLDSVQIR
jgi:polar amino acid transport system substrate-binding protein